jgi:hypothetical protein
MKKHKNIHKKKGHDDMHTKGLEVQECENMHKKKGCIIMKIKSLITISLVSKW